MPAPGTMRPLRGGVHLRGVDHPTSGDRHGQEPGQEEGREEKTGEDAEGKARGEEGEESRPLSRLFLVPRIEGAANVTESAWAPGADALGANVHRHRPAASASSLILPQGPPHPALRLAHRKARY